MTTQELTLISEAENRQADAWQSGVKSAPSALSNVTIDCVVFGLRQGRLKVLTVEYAGGESAGLWALPGGWVHHDESIDEAAGRHLRELTGIDRVFLEQLRAFGDVRRAGDRRVITIAYYALVHEEDFDLVVGNTTSSVRWSDLGDPGNLIFDHSQILQAALASLRHKIRHEPIGFNLLPQKFTLLQLQELYEAILGVKLDKPNFRRKMMKMKLLMPCGEKQQNVAHRAAELYRFDEEVYRELCQDGFTFEV